MEISISLANLIALAGVATGLTLAVILFIVDWGNRRANSFLTTLLLVYCIVAMTSVLLSEQYLSPSKILWLASLQMTIGPLIYFYTLSLMHQDLTTKRAYYWHLLPALLMMLLWLWQLVYEPAFLILPCFNLLENCQPLFQIRFIHRLAAWVSLLVYCVVLFRRLKLHQKQIESVYSVLGDVNLYWLKLILYSIVVSVFLSILMEFYIYITGASEVTKVSLLAFSPLVSTLLMGGFGLKQKLILESEDDKIAASLVLNTEVAHTGSAQTKTLDQKYKTSSLTDSAASEIWQALQDIMQEQKLYLKHGLKVSDLAKVMNVSVHHLSEAINGYAKQSFYDFVNKHRIDAAIGFMSDPEKDYFSINDIGFQAGFNSSSAFFTHFKKHVRQTPSVYRKKLLLAR